jgi:DNA processing protein
MPSEINFSSADELRWQIALTMIPGIGCALAHLLIKHFGTASAIFKASKTDLELDGQISGTRANALLNFNNFKAVDRTIAFVCRYGIQVLFITDPGYPFRLREINDPPILLYYKGHAALNHRHVLTVIGTRTPTDYGRQVASVLLRELAVYDVLIVSGVDDGIDTAVHRHALINGLPAVGVLAHGLDTLYPAGNRLMAKEMIRHGGLLTEFREGTTMAAYHFPLRNRLLAAIPEATVVIESDVGGGIVKTATLARDYNREIFAIPGRIFDSRSSGCHWLVYKNIAQLVTSARDIAQALNWEAPSNIRPVEKKTINQYPSLTVLLENRQSVHLDELQSRSGLSATVLASALLNLELDRIIESAPGKRYRLKR